ncbi:retrovirus-related pol polyprotein from transposon TNT 1-94 [Tanacetum coccineum]
MNCEVAPQVVFRCVVVILGVLHCEPLVFEEAMKNKKWRQVMEEEIKSIKKNDTWELTTLPKGQKDIGKHGIDYEEVFAPVARLETIRMIIAIAAQYRWKIYQMCGKLEGG